MNFVIIMTNTQNQSMDGAYGKSFDMQGISKRENFDATIKMKPALHQLHNREHPVDNRGWQVFHHTLLMQPACNTHINRNIGQFIVIDEIDKFHPEDTYIAYSSYYGDIQYSQDLHSKSLMLYEEVTSVTNIISAPGYQLRNSSNAKIFHLNLQSTRLSLADIPSPEVLQCMNQVPFMVDPNVNVNAYVTC